jgi:FkbM family methyltransferase
MFSVETIFSWIPVPKIKPLNSFPNRLVNKWMWIIERLLNLLGINAQFFGAKKIGTTASGNTLLRLVRSYPLGKKGTILEIPQDNEIYENVRVRGEWELAESIFLANGLKIVSENNHAKVAFLDIGANVGLVTLQCCNIYSKANCEYFLFEPIKNHVLAIHSNLSQISREFKVHIKEFALSDRFGSAIMHTEHKNRGNTSIFNSVVPIEGQIQTEIELIDTSVYLEQFIDLYDGFVIKCDTQGMDALILSRVPQSIWRRTERVVLEVWALPEVDEMDVDKLIEMFDYFRVVSWTTDTEERITNDEIRKFWLGKSSRSRNLFLSKHL